MTTTAGWRLADLLAGLAPVPIGVEAVVTGLALDSRRVVPGDLFLATAGRCCHGLDHVAEAINRGAAAIVWEPVAGTAGRPIPGKIPMIAVAGLGRRAGGIADRFYGHPSGGMEVVGVTGTDGKTSVCHFAAQLIDAEGSPCGITGTLGCGLYSELEGAPCGDCPLTTPDAVTVQRTLAELRDRGARRVVMEISSHALDQGRVEGVDFDVAVLTNLSRDHLDYHGSERAYAEAKRRLFSVSGLSCAILNADDAFGLSLRDNLAPGVRAICYTLTDRPCDGCDTVSATIQATTERGTVVAVRSPWGEGEVEIALPGRFNVENALAALATALAVGTGFDAALARLSGLRPVPGRMESYGGGDRPTIVVDYAHTPNALGHALRSLRPHCKGRLWCIFGAGGDRDRGKRPLMAEAVKQYADRIVVTSDNPRGEAPLAIIADIMEGFDGQRRSVHTEPDREAAIRLAWEEAAPGDIILVAGKGCETIQIVGDEARPWSDCRFARELVEGGAA